MVFAIIAGMLGGGLVIEAIEAADRDLAAAEAAAERRASAEACYNLLDAAHSVLGGDYDSTAAAITEALRGGAPASDRLRDAVGEIGCPAPHVIGTHARGWALDAKASFMEAALAETGTVPRPAAENSGARRAAELEAVAAALAEAARR